MWLSILAIWGCVPEFAKGCIDMTNSSSAYLGIAGGIAIGAVISWWIYNRQNKIGGTHHDILQRIEKLEEKNTNILAHLDAFAKRHDNILNKILHLNENILALDKKIESINEKRD
jgi:allophanate hydrolase subunit 2